MKHAITLLLSALALASVPAHAKGNPEAGKAKSTPCQACHGNAGTSASPDFPNLAGQHADYLYTALRHYKLGKRKNGIMAGQVANLSDADMRDLAAFYAAQKGLTVKY
jgi:cytochrome c553